MIKITAAGHISKMRAVLADAVQYQLPLGDQLIPLNELLGKKIQLKYSGMIACSHCGRATKTSFNQGYCYPCFKKLAQCDSCIVSPEKCHYFAGTCREPAWGEQYCMQDHIVYLANSSGLKVGITRHSQVPVRWMDQGATQALPILRVSNRLQSGLVEVIFKKHVADKTNWQAMLKGDAAPIDLAVMRDRLFKECADEISALQHHHGLQAITLIDNAEMVTIKYPVLQYPVKVTSVNFDKQALIEGVLKGIKGQYLMLDTGVINIRKHESYHIEFSA